MCDHRSLCKIIGLCDPQYFRILDCIHISVPRYAIGSTLAIYHHRMRQDIVQDKKKKKAAVTHLKNSLVPNDISGFILGVYHFHTSQCHYGRYNVVITYSCLEISSCIYHSESSKLL